MGGIGETSTERAAEPWHVSKPELLDDVRSALNAYPALHLFVTGSKFEIRGTFPVRDESGRTLDEYSVSIELPSNYPSALPIVRETAGRIPRILDRHVLPGTGTCCVMLPDARWEEYPVGAPFSDYLTGPLRNFFLGQSTVELGGEWPFGEWDHGNPARLDYYRQIFDTDNEVAVRRFLEAIGWPHRKGRVNCPCGSSRRLHKCCRAKVHDLRAKIPRETARSAFTALGYKRHTEAGRASAAKRRRRK